MNSMNPKLAMSLIAIAAMAGAGTTFAAEEILDERARPRRDPYRDPFGGPFGGYHVATTYTPTPPTADVQATLDAAEAKRERKNAKRIREARAREAKART